ncbi:MAG: glycoside hydrolase family 9 protein [Bacteroidota bacterium]
MMMKNLWLQLIWLFYFPMVMWAQDGEWKPLKTGAGGWITGLYIHPSGGPIYARSDVGGAYRWEADQAKWVNIVTAENFSSDEIYWNTFSGVLSIVAAPTNPDIAYIAYYNGIFKSEDKGNNWIRTEIPYQAMNANTDEGKLAGERLSVDPANANIVYFGSLENGLWRTENGGDYWKQVEGVPTGETGRGIRQVLFDPTSGVTNNQTNRIYALVDEAGVYQSEDGGKTWVLNPFNVASPYFLDAELSPNGHLFVCGESSTGNSFGVQRFDGLTWRHVFSSDRTIGELAIDPFNYRRMFLFSQGFTDTYRSSNAHTNQPTWDLIGFQKTATTIPWLAWTTSDWFSLGEIVFDPQTPNTLWMADGLGVWKSNDLSDNQITWEETSNQQEHLVSNDLIALPEGQSLSAHWDRPLFHHADPDVYPSIHHPSNRFNTAWDLDVSPSDPNFVVGIIEDHRFCCYDDDTRSSGYSTDGGQNWTKFAAMPEPGNTNFLAGVIAVSANDNNNIVWLPGGNRPPYFTTDRGQSWTLSPLPGSSDQCCIDAHWFKRKVLVADRVLDHTFYLYDWGAGSIFKSSNGGQNWVKYTNTGLSAGAFNAKLVAVPGQAGHLFFANGPEQTIALIEGLYHSTDGGQNWTLLTNTSEVLNVAVGKTAPGANYPTLLIHGRVNETLGYFQSTDQGQTWTQIATFPLGLYDVASVLEGDPHRYGRWYVGFAGSGFAYYQAAGPDSSSSVCHDVNEDGICDFSEFIHIDQFGYLSNQSKVAVLSNPETGYNSAGTYTPGTVIELRDADSDAIVFSAAPQIWNNGATHAQSGDQGWWFDFSSISTEGSYFVYDPENELRSSNFQIGEAVYGEVLKAATKMFYYNRCGLEKTAPYAANGWTDAESFNHPLQDVNCRYVYDPENEGLEKDLSGGWFDAGDYNKYVTFTHSVIHNLLWAYRENPAAFEDNWNIPESGNGIPDLLDEVKWELNWLLKMINADGSVHIKMGSIDYGDNALAPPSLNTDRRYYGPTCTSASIAVASMLSHAALVLQDIPSWASYAATLETNAINAWNHVLPSLNNNQLDEACDDGTIKAGDADWSSAEQKENAVAAAIYLYELTNDNSYSQYVSTHLNDTEPIYNNYWDGYKLALNDALLLYTTLPGADATTLAQILNSAEANTAGNWNNFYGFNELDLYRSHMPDAAYHWGSNSIKAGYGVLNQIMDKYNIDLPGGASYQQKAAEQVHYFHGVNPLGLVYLTNMYAYGGDRCADEMYHTWFAHGSDWDNAQTSLYGPAPGFITGGPNVNFTVNSLSPPYNQPHQKSYLDFNDGFPLNSWEITEPAIYYQATYIRLLANYSAACDNCPTCFDGIQNGDEEGVDCGGSLCPPCPCTDASITLNLNFDNFPEETNWELTDHSGVVLFAGGPYPEVADGSTLTEVFCLPAACYTFSIFDSYGDGICCDHGNGSYTLSDEANNILASGSAFGAQESTNFCLGGDCSNCDMITSSTVLSTQHSSNKIQLFPNPNEGQFQLSIHSEKGQVLHYQLIDLNGKALQRGQFDLQAGANQLEVQIASKIAGLYLLQLTLANEVISKRLIIK